MAFGADTPMVYSGTPIHVAYTCVPDALRDAGLGCSEDEPCWIFLELSGVEAVASRLFVSGNLHTTSTTLGSILLLSEDGGRTWQEGWQRTPYLTLDEIQFIDFEHGWIAGENVQTVARDPFLLTTEDGGATWRVQPLFAEGQPGAIQRFWFESPKAGTVLVDRGVGNRYELYRTATGGASWELLQASRDPLRSPGGRAKEATAAWRLHPDARTASWQIEQNRDEVWRPVAAFATEITVCR
jgi:hypothetical protein